MLAIPPALQSKYAEQLISRIIPVNLQESYQKWLRYYLDFCQKYMEYTRTNRFAYEVSF